MKEFRVTDLIRPYRGLLLSAILLQVFFSVLGLTLPWMLKIAIDKILPNADYELFFMLCLGMGVIYGLRCVIRYASGLCGTYTVTRILVDIRNRIFKHLQSLSLRFYTEYRTGKLISNVISDAALLQQLVGLMIGMSDQIFTSMLIVFLLFFLNFKLALVVLLVLPLHFINFYYFHRLMRRDSMKLQEKMSEISANLAENINGIKVVKSFARERAVCRNFFCTMRPTIDLNVQLNLTGNLCYGICDVLFLLTYLLLIGLGISQVRSGNMTFGDFAAFYTYVGILLGPINMLTVSTLTISQGMTGATRLTNLLKVIPEIQEDKNPVQPGILRGNIVFHHVNFHYKDTPVLRDFDLDIKAGEKVALVGPSGCGKSTASNLIMRFYDVSEGTLTVDGVDVRRYALEAYRSNIGVVLQEPFLFSGTIRENIAFAKKDATDAEVEAAARLANVEEFVKTLPQGYETVLGENGATMSGGQKQRLAIARAVLKNPSILILDEATSALDTVSEHLVQDALDTVMRGRTTIIIAHRLSTIRNADKIVVLRDGMIQQLGKHDELMAQPGIYRDLYNTQMKDIDHGTKS